MVSVTVTVGHTLGALTTNLVTSTTSTLEKGSDGVNHGRRPNKAGKTLIAHMFMGVTWLFAGSMWMLS